MRTDCKCLFVRFDCQIRTRINGRKNFSYCNALSHIGFGVVRVMCFCFFWFLFSFFGSALCLLLPPICLRVCIGDVKNTKSHIHVTVCFILLLLLRLRLRRFQYKQAKLLFDCCRTVFFYNFIFLLFFCNSFCWLCVYISRVY